MRIVKPGTDEKVKEEIFQQLRKEGHRPYLLPVGGNSPQGVAGYMNAMLELVHQASELGIGVDYVIHASGSGGTQAGTVIGSKALNSGIKVICSTTGSRAKEQARGLVLDIIGKTLKFFDLAVQISEEDVRIYDTYAGGGYGFMTPGKAEAIKLLAETEGLILDPVYTGSAMACLIDLCRQGVFKRSDVVVFIHTGGQAGLFPYRAPLKAYGMGATLPWTVPPWFPSTG